MPKPAKRKRSLKVFEAGSGQNPVGLVQQAAKAKEHGRRKRIFTGVDIEKTNLDKILKKLKIPRKPANLKIIQKCAIDALNELRPESQHIIFSSYLINVLAHHGKSQNMLKNMGEFVSAAKKALRPGGRLILVQDAGTGPIIKDIALTYGLGFHKKTLTDEQARKSPALYIRLRATPKRRALRINEHLARTGLGPMGIVRMMQEIGAPTPEEIMRPTVYVLQKPRKGEKKIQGVTIRGLDLIDDPAIRNAVKGILG